MSSQDHPPNYSSPLDAQLLSGPNYYFPDREQWSQLKYMWLSNWIWRLTKLNPFIYLFFFPFSQFQNPSVPNECQNDIFITERSEMYTFIIELESQSYFYIYLAGIMTIRSNASNRSINLKTSGLCSLLLSCTPLRQMASKFNKIWFTRSFKIEFR